MHGVRNTLHTGKTQALLIPTVKKHIHGQHIILNTPTAHKDVIIIIMNVQFLCALTKLAILLISSPNTFKFCSISSISL